jgi:secondary thiamine-phosphate synthase enzyme
MVKTKHITLSTKGRDQVIDITGEVQEIVNQAKIDNGLATVFVHGSTASVTTIEYEPGLVKDIKNMDEKLIPSDVCYAHDAAWGDANGYAHLRASLYGPSLSIPVEKGTLTLGTWQQIIVIDHDNRPREREIVVQVIGE